MKKCTYHNCDKEFYCKDFCRTHYNKVFGLTRKYEKTVNGFLMRAYRNMKSRVTGVQKKKAHLYEGLELLEKETFYTWSKNNADFHRLFKHWTINNYDQKLSPSVNRIDPNVGYVIGNIEWITHSMNSALSSVTKRNKNNNELTAIYKAVGVKSVTKK